MVFGPSRRAGFDRSGTGAVADPEVSVSLRGRCARVCRSGRTPSRFHKLLASLRLWRNLRDGHAVLALAAVDGTSDPVFSDARRGIGEGWDVQQPTLRRGRSEAAIPRGKAIEPALRGWLVAPGRRSNRLRVGREGLGARLRAHLKELQSAPSGFAEAGSERRSAGRTRTSTPARAGRTLRCRWRSPRNRRTRVRPHDPVP